MTTIHVAISSRATISELDQEIHYSRVKNPEVVEMRLTYAFWDDFPFVPDSIDSIKTEMKYNGFDRLLEKAGVSYSDEEIQKTNLEARQDCHVASAVRKVRPLVEELRRRGVTPQFARNGQYSTWIEKVAKQLEVEFLSPRFEGE
jgi:hypothetical protein